MPNMEELISKISAKITNGEGEIWMSKIDLDYAYGQAKLAKEAAKHCVFNYWRRLHWSLSLLSCCIDASLCFSAEENCEFLETLIKTRFKDFRVTIARF